MNFLRLAAAQNAINPVDNVNLDQRQMAITDRSPELLESIKHARRDNKVRVLIGGRFRLLVGDTSAIWRAHQETQIQQADFDSLYNFLAQRPDQAVSFVATFE